jgi:hypothetical protein
VDPTELHGQRLDMGLFVYEQLLLLLLLLFMRSSDPYKARSPLDIELVNG